MSEDRWIVTEETEDFWRKPTSREEKAIKTWGELVYKRGAVRSCIIGVVVVLLMLLAGYALSEHSGTGSSTDPWFLAKMSIYLMVGVAVFFFESSGNMAHRKYIDDCKYTVTEAKVKAKSCMYTRRGIVDIATLSYGPGKETDSYLFRNDRASIYDHIKIDTSVLLIKFDDDKRGYLGSDYDCIMVELFEKKEETHEG